MTLLQVIFRAIVPLAISSLTACASTNDSKAEPIIGSAVDEMSLRFSAISTGCTSKSDFSFSIDRTGDGNTRLTIVRNKVDGCRRMPFVQAFEYSLEEVGVQPNEKLVVTNPITKLARVKRND